MDKTRIADKKIIASLLTTIAGGILVVGDTYGWIVTENHVWLGVGCSLLAAAASSFLTIFLVDQRQEKAVDMWGLDKAYTSRADKNKDSDPRLKDLRYRLDGVAFGLKTFRSVHSDEIKDALRRGVEIRLLTMSPSSPFVEQREKEEQEQPGQIRNTILQLVEWANSLNEQGFKGSITVKGYNCMTLDFYWRMDDDIYFGPYWYGKPSQQTVTYKLVKDGLGFELYEKYFESIWCNDTLTEQLTKSRK